MNIEVLLYTVKFLIKFRWIICSFMDIKTDYSIFMYILSIK